MKVSTIFAHCEYEESEFRCKVEIKEYDTPYLDLCGVIGIFITRERLEQLRDAITAAISSEVTK